MAECGSEIFLSCFNPPLPSLLNNLNQVRYKPEMFSFFPSAMLSGIAFSHDFGKEGRGENVSSLNDVGSSLAQLPLWLTFLAVEVPLFWAS